MAMVSGFCGITRLAKNRKVCLSRTHFLWLLWLCQARQAKPSSVLLEKQKKMTIIFLKKEGVLFETPLCDEKGREAYPPARGSHSENFISFRK